jgi:hypothetical protein
MKTSSVILFALSTLNLFVRPMAFSHLWRWFVVPATGFHEVGYFCSLGILMMHAAFFRSTQTVISLEPESDEASVRRAAASFASALIVLAVGYVIQRVA